MRVLPGIRLSVVLIALLWGGGDAFADVVTPTADTSGRLCAFQGSAS
jgi:hypothetical protein